MLLGIDGQKPIQYTCPHSSQNAVVAQLVEHVHGKDGVTGSIPVNGSIKKRPVLRGVFYSGRLSKRPERCHSWQIVPQLRGRGQTIWPSRLR